MCIRDRHSSGASVKSKQREKLIELQGADGNGGRQQSCVETLQTARYRYITVSYTHLPSLNLLEKVGFIKDGVLRKRRIDKNKMCIRDRYTMDLTMRSIHQRWHSTLPDLCVSKRLWQRPHLYYLSLS